MCRKSKNTKYFWDASTTCSVITYMYTNGHQYILWTVYDKKNNIFSTFLGVALTDSPAGLLAYIVEKFSTWTVSENRNLPDGGLNSGKFSKDQLIDNLMMYWTSNSITTSVRLYAESFSDKHRALELDRWIFIWQCAVPKTRAISWRSAHEHWHYIIYTNYFQLFYHLFKSEKHSYFDIWLLGINLKMSWKSVHPLMHNHYTHVVFLISHL